MPTYKAICPAPTTRPKSVPVIGRSDFLRFSLLYSGHDVAPRHRDGAWGPNLIGSVLVQPMGGFQRKERPQSEPDPEGPERKASRCSNGRALKRSIHAFTAPSSVNSTPSASIAFARAFAGPK